jgi:hypothetical protein
MWRMTLSLCIVCTALLLTSRVTQSATTIPVSNADKVYHYTLRQNTTLNTTLANAPATILVEGARLFSINFQLSPTALQSIYTTLHAQIFVDSADMQFIPSLTIAPTALQSIYTTLQARIFVDHADAQFVPVLTQASANLQAIYSALQARIYVGHADAQFVPVLIPIILDNGVPTGTVARAAGQLTQSNLATPTATATVDRATATIQTSTNSSQIYSPTPVLTPIVTPPQATTHTYTAEPATTETATTLIPLPSATATPTSVKQQLNTPTP